MKTPILAWINCYGAWAPELRHPIETIGYNEYLDSVTHALVALKDRVTVAYVSGGMYDEKRRTECATTIPELKRRLAAQGFPSLEIIADEESITSASIVKKFLQTWNSSYRDHEALLFVDEGRYEINAYTLEYFAQKLEIALPDIRAVLVPFRRLDDHPNSTAAKQAEKLQRMREEGVEAIEREEIEQRKEHLKN